MEEIMKSIEVKTFETPDEVRMLPIFPALERVNLVADR
jgi:hypothetical protein